MPWLRASLIGLLVTLALPAATAAQRAARGTTSGTHLIPSLTVGGLWWSPRSVGALGATVLVEVGKGAVVGAFGMEGWAPLSGRCMSRGISLCENPDYGTGAMGGVRWRHPLGGRRQNTLVLGASVGTYYWAGTTLATDPGPGFTIGAGIDAGTDFRASRRRPGWRVSTGIRLMATGATLLTASIGPRIPL